MVGVAEFWLLIVTGPKVSAVKFISGDESLRPFTADFATVELLNPLADATDVKLFVQANGLVRILQAHALSY